MALTQWYVDPSRAGEGDVGTGTLGDPYSDLQYALNTITRDATNGDQVNIKAGTAEVLAATLTLATYGAPTELAPLVLRGYTASANDGGMAQITAGGAFPIVNIVVPSVAHTCNTFYIDLKLTSAARQATLSVNNPNVFINCLFDGAGYGAEPTQGGFFFRCTFRHAQSQANAGSANIQNGAVINCLFVEPSLNAWNTQKAAIRVVYGQSHGGVVDGNVIILNDTSDIHGIAVEGGGHGLVRNNLVYNRAAGIGAGIYLDENNNLVVANVYNNILAGFSGTGGCGIKTGDANFMLGLLGSNAFYNCTTNESLIEPEVYRVPGDVTLTADPLTDVANGDYTLTATAQAVLRAAGWPGTYLSSPLDPMVSIGALQYGPVPAGGGFPKIASVLGRMRM